MLMSCHLDFHNLFIHSLAHLFIYFIYFNKTYLFIYLFTHSSFIQLFIYSSFSFIQPWPHHILTHIQSIHNSVIYTQNDSSLALKLFGLVILKSHWLQK